MFVIFGKGYCVKFLRLRRKSADSDFLFRNQPENLIRGAGQNDRSSGDENVMFHFVKEKED